MTTGRSSGVASTGRARDPVPVRVVIVEDHQMVVEGLAAGLALDDRLDVVGTAATLAEFGAGRATWDPAVVVADYNLPDGRGTELTALHDGRLDHAVLLISGEERTEVVAEAIANGCAGFMSKGAPIGELADAIVGIDSGESCFPAQALERSTSRDRTEPGATLTPREAQVLGLLAAAHSASEISEQLSVSTHTTRNHIRSILAKLHARTQLEAVLKAQRAGLIRPGPEPERTP